MLYVNDVAIVSPSSQGLGRVMKAMVIAFLAFGLSVSESKAEIMCLQT